MGDSLPAASVSAHHGANQSRGSHVGAAETNQIAGFRKTSSVFWRVGQLYADVCWSVQSNWKVCIP